MSNSDTIAVRGWLAIVATGAALAFSIALDAREGFGDPFRPPDRTLAARISLVASWMLPVGLLIGPAALLRAKNGALFEGRKSGGRILPLIFGALGLALFVTKWVRWGPYTGEDFTMFQGWEFGVALLLVWWSVVFARIGSDA